MLDKYYGKDHFVRKRTAREKGELKERIGWDPKGPNIRSVLQRVDRILAHRLMGLLFEYNRGPSKLQLRHAKNIERRNNFNSTHVN